VSRLKLLENQERTFDQSVKKKKQEFEVGERERLLCR